MGDSMSISPYFSDAELESQLRMHFPIDEQYDVDFRTLFNQIVDRGLDYYFEFRGKKFSIDKLTGTVTEIGEDME